MLEIAVCDDDAVLCRRLARILERNVGLLPGPARVRQFTRAQDLLAALPFDIIFLDIELGDTTGIQVAEEIRKRHKDLILVFVSSHDSYLRELFSLDTTAFLDKPVDEGKIQKLLPNLAERFSDTSRTFIYRVKESLYHTLFSDIILFESRARQIKIVTLKKKDVFYGKLDDIEADLRKRGQAALPKGRPAFSFVRPHQSYLVNMDHIERFEKTYLEMSGGIMVPIVRKRQPEINRLVITRYGGGA